MAKLDSCSLVSSCEDVLLEMLRNAFPELAADSRVFVFSQEADLPPFTLDQTDKPQAIA